MYVDDRTRGIEIRALWHAIYAARDAAIRNPLYEPDWFVAVVVHAERVIAHEIARVDAGAHNTWCDPAGDRCLGAARDILRRLRAARDESAGPITGWADLAIDTWRVVMDTAGFGYVRG